MLTTDMHSFVPSKTLAELPELQAAIRAFTKNQRVAVRKVAIDEYSALPDSARQLLYEWSLVPFTPLARLYDKIGRPSPEKDRAIREALVTGGYASFEEIRIGRRNMALFEPKEAAWKLLGKPPIALRGRGGVAHRHLAHWVAMAAKKTRIRGRVR